MRPLTDLETAEVHLLNARLDAQRRFASGEFTREELDLIEREAARALGTLRLLGVVLLPTQAPVREGV